MVKRSGTERERESRPSRINGRAWRQSWMTCWDPEPCLARRLFSPGTSHAVRVKRVPLDTAIHEQNGYVKVCNDKYTFKTGVDNDNSDTTYTNKHKHNMREV